MQVTNTQRATPTESYGRGAIAFHWAVALLVFWVGLLGMLHDSWPKRTHAYWINIHALSGLALWVLVIARSCWRIVHPAPSLPANLGAAYRYGSRVVNFALYVLLWVTPVVGMVAFIWHGRAFDFGAFSVKFGIASNRAVFEPTEDLHGYLAYGLFALAATHIVAALWHQYVRRDGVMQRMWPRSN